MIYNIFESCGVSQVIIRDGDIVYLYIPEEGSVYQEQLSRQGAASQLHWARRKQYRIVKVA